MNIRCKTRKIRANFITLGMKDKAWLTMPLDRGLIEFPIWRKKLQYWKKQIKTFFGMRGCRWMVVGNKPCSNQRIKYYQQGLIPLLQNLYFELWRPWMGKLTSQYARTAWHAVRIAQISIKPLIRPHLAETFWHKSANRQNDEAPFRALFSAPRQFISTNTSIKWR